MTFGEKIRKARKDNGLTQEQLAEKLMVSRQAITKWESNKGLPDVTNLKSISLLLNVSVDYLLDDQDKTEINIIKETIDFSKYGNCKKLKVKDQIVRDKFPNAEIRRLLPKKKLDKAEKIVDTFIWLTTMFVNVIDFMNSLKLIGNEFYLVNQENKQFLVIVSNEFIESRQIANNINSKKFTIGDMDFLVCKYII